MTNHTDLFSKQAELYFKHRPKYPEKLFTELAKLSPNTNLVWDCACGNGQATETLSKSFAKVIATDISAEQIRNAPTINNVSYLVLKAEEKLPIQDNSVDLICVAQAIHWFDLDLFYSEAKRVLKKNGIIAIWGYSFHLTDNEKMKTILNKFYFETLKPFWKENNKLLWNNYNKLKFPFAIINMEDFHLTANWSLNDLIMYFKTWSSTQLYMDSKRSDPTIELKNELLPHWGDENFPKEITWPLTLKVGRIPYSNS